MAKNANIRFENANVAYVNVDTDTHELTGGVMDETTGTFYPVGGGGGVSNKVIEITFINNTGSSIGPYLYIINETEVRAVQYEIANGETEVINAAVIPVSNDGPEGPFTYAVELWQMQCTKTASDAVNCTYDSGDDVVTLTDTSENGSITLTLS